MAWFRSVRDRLNNFGLRDPHFERDAGVWGQWAAEHGWTYQAEATQELTQRYARRPEDGAELYCHLLRTQLHGCDVFAFEHRTFAWGRGNSESSSTLTSVLVLRLPGVPPKEYVKMGATKAIGKLGGSPPSGYGWKFLDDELVGYRSGHLDPRSLDTSAENMAMQLAILPASFWRPGS